MLRTLVVLPDGTELFSGVGSANAIKSASITECVNGAQELTLGSVCANMAEVKIIAPEGGLSISAGDEMTVYKVDDGGQCHKIGLFTMEKPTREGANRLSITAYDRISWLDKDLTQWLMNLDSWPYALHDFAVMVCDACGLTLVNESIPNGGYPVQKFSADGITGRQLMQWIGEAAGRFCRATADGEIEFAWYSPAKISVGAVRIPEADISFDYQEDRLTINSQKIAVEDDGAGNVTIESDLIQVEDDGEGNVTLLVSDAASQIFYYQNGLSFEDYQVSAIQKLQIRQSEEDIGTVYPDLVEEANTYIITGNYLLTAESAEDLIPVAQALYEQLKYIVYTPCKVSVPATLDIRAGNTVQITDRNGKTITAYVMTKTQAGQKDTLECTGSARRASSTAVNNQTFKALSGKVLNIRKDVDGLKIENKDTAGRVTLLEADVDGIRSQVSEQKGTTDGLISRMSTIEQTADAVRIKVEKIQENGAEKVKTQAGYSFTDEGLIISQSGEQMENRINHTGMYVERSDEIILQANDKGVVATDVSVRNYLVIGNHARFEDYTNGTDGKRTACFWLEEV